MKKAQLWHSKGQSPQNTPNPYEFRVESIPLPWVMYSPSEGAQWMRRARGRLECRRVPGITVPKINPWNLRTRMLQAQSEGEVLAFLNDGGMALRCKSVEHFRQWQRIFRYALVNPVDKWNRIRDWLTGDEELLDKIEDVLTPLNMRHEWVAGELVMSVHAQSFIEVVAATIHVDQLRHRVYRECARDDCGG
jgi:hypothetical protein